MRLIYIANARIPTEKANGYQIMKMCESFSDLGQNVTLVVPTKKNKIKDDPFEYYGIKENFKIRKIKSFDFVGYFPQFGRLSFWLQNLFFNIAVFFTKIEKDAVLYTRSGSIAFIFRLRGRKVFFESHRIINATWIYRIIFGRKLKIIALTESARKEYINLGVPKVNVITAPDGVDLNLFDLSISKEEAREKLNLDRNKKIVGYFGSFRTMGEDKGLMDAVEAFRGLDNSFMLLAVGGLDKEVSEYTEKSEKIIKKDKFIFKKPVSRSEIVLYQKACDVLLIPFPWNKHFAYYASALKMFEYMASKQPIIATDLPSIREILDENTSVIVLPGNPEKLSEAIKDLLNNPEKGQKLAENAFERVKGYTWEKRAESILRFINK